MSWRHQRTSKEARGVEQSEQRVWGVHSDHDLGLVLVHTSQGRHGDYVRCRV